MQELIHVTTNEQGSRVVSARELYEFLEIKTLFKDWMPRMLEYGFEDGKDFSSFLSKSVNGGRPTIEYTLTLDTAKEIAMLQRSEKGKQARQYFIECEKQLKAIPQSPAQLLLQQAQLLVDIELRQTATEAKVQEIEAKLTTRPEYFTVMGYAMLTKVKVGLSLAAQIGRRAKAICQQKGYPIDKIKDPRFGEVGCYPTDVLQEAFAAQVF